MPTGMETFNLELSQFQLKSVSNAKVADTIFSQKGPSARNLTYGYKYLQDDLEWGLKNKFASRYM